MSNFNQKLEKLLKTDSRFIDQDGDLLKSEVVDKAWKVDRKLVELLLEDKEVKSKFFTEIKGHWIFNVSIFVDFVQDKNFLNDSYTKFKNKIGLTIDGKYLNQRGEVALAWPYKDCVLEGGMSDEETKRDEIFFNEILAQDEIDCLLDPKVLTNFKRYTQDGEQKVTGFKRDGTGQIKDNLIIKGNNLIALHCLKKQFAGKVKLIYIDPPYNTGSDGFRYNDRFNHSTWLTFMKNRLEVAKEFLRDDGVIFVQCDDNEQAYLKILMDEVFERENHINTVAVNMKNVAGASGGGEDKKLKKNIEYLHIYAKNYSLFNSFKNAFNYIPISDVVKKYKEEGVSWKYTSILIYEGDKKYIGSTEDGNGDEIKIFLRENPIIKSIKKTMSDEKMTEPEVYRKYANKIFQTAMPQSSIRPRVMKKVKELNGNGVLYSIEYVPKSGKSKGQIYEQFYKGDNFRLLAWLRDVAQEIDGVLCKKDMQGTYWDFVGETKNLSKEGDVQLLSGKKPERLLERIVDMATQQGDLILDYHLGSGTTCAVAHKMNRQYIGIEQMEYIKDVTIPRLKKVIDGEQGGISESRNWKGGGEFIYFELKTYNQDFIDRIQTAKDTNALEKIWAEMKEKSFLNWNVDFRQADLAFEEWEKLDLEKQKHALIQLLNKNQLYVNYSEIEDEEFRCSEEEKKLSREFYGF